VACEKNHWIITEQTSRGRAACYQMYKLRVGHPAPKSQNPSYQFRPRLSFREISRLSLDMLLEISKQIDGSPMMRMQKHVLLSQ
jgi:hypothetical protein